MIDFDILWPKYGINPGGVLHLGANTGQEAPVYQKHGVQSVIWIEAIPEIYHQLKENLMAYKGQTAFCACVGDQEGKEIEFNVSNNEAQSSSYLELGHHSVIHPTVHYTRKFITNMRRVDAIFPPETFDGKKWFLNADLQGSELQAFQGMGDLIKKFDWVYSEINFLECYKGGALVGEIDQYLSKFGFSRVETGPVVGETWTDALYIKQ